MYQFTPPGNLGLDFLEAAGELVSRGESSICLGRGTDIPAECNNGLRLTMWLCSLMGHSDVSEEGVWLLGPQPDVLNIQRHQEYCGSWGELDRSLGCALAQMESKPPICTAARYTTPQPAEAQASM